uniref:DNA-directed RNA polymerase n=1 Tax=Heterorhabditis bacteriophora TaxID=37862 RepID=A0A1I7X5M0_HETBA
MGGREGLIDTAVKTAETGYIQRRLIKVCYGSFYQESKYHHKMLYKLLCSIEYLFIDIWFTLRPAVLIRFKPYFRCNVPRLFTLLL